MQVQIIVRKGPLEGQTFSLELGLAALGRSPGPKGISLPGDMEVALQHGELMERAGGIVYRNLSPKGTLVNGKRVDGEVPLKSGSRLGFGAHHLLEVRFESARRKTPTAAPARTRVEAQPGLLKSGPLAKPAIRIVLAAYLLGFVALVAYLMGRGTTDLTAEFESVRAEYEALYAPAGTPESELAARLRRAEALITQLEIAERKEDWILAREICRQIMALDSDQSSPLYRFSAQRLGDLADKR